MMMMSVAVVFDDSMRPDTTGIYCHRALRELCAAGKIGKLEHLSPKALHDSRDSDHDLWILIDDGLDYDLPSSHPPIAWWAIDTHLNFERCLSRAQQATWTFCAQAVGAQRFKASGVDAVWLPLACDPAIHSQRTTTRSRDLAFVGNLIGEERIRLLQLIQSRYPDSYIGHAHFEDMANLYSSSRIGFNRSVADDVNMRVFEVLCSGAMLLTNRIEHGGLSDILQLNEEYVEYSSDAELIERLNYYLSHDEEREKIAAAGRAAVLSQHTYRHRMEMILDTINKPQSRSVLENITGKSREYFEFDRPEVLDLVPHDSRVVLDVGCGGGRLGRAVKLRQDAHVSGIEIHADAAQIAAQYLDHIENRNIESDEVKFEPASFDCVICADVLEHMCNPTAVLKRLHRWLTDGGSLIASIPNVRNHSVVSSLLAGNWTYEPAGLLDADHKQFFTRREIEKLLFRTGFEVSELRMVPGEGFREWNDAGRPCEVKIGSLLVQTATPEDAFEFFVYQYLVRCQKKSTPTYPLTSIIIVTHNQQAYTRLCIESIQMRTDEQYELILIDNASSDGTPGYLRSIAGAKVVCNSENRGFPAAVNQGLKIASGQQILLLNNDVIVTTGWLRRLLEALYADPETGMVGPVSNNVSGYQQVPVAYQQLSDIDGAAWDGHSRHQTTDSTFREVDRLIGFCLLLKREVLDSIGTLDERFGIGNFEDDDYVRRARNAGYRAVVATNSFVHHFGSVSFRGAGIDFKQLLTDNQRIFEEKWADTTTMGIENGSGGTLQPKRAEQVLALKAPRPRFSVTTREDGQLQIVPNATKVSLCMIVRNNAETIRPCLESIREWVDELIVVDTGSTDGTPEICRELGAQVHHWEWRDDFAAARNESLRYARGEWVFWMDSDDTIPEACGQKLRSLVDQDHAPSVMGYVMQVHCPGRNGEGQTIVDHIKLFRNRPDLQFEFRIHEQIIPAIRRAGGEVAWTDVYVVHSGSDQSAEAQARKRERDFRILRLELGERPNHPFALFNIGMTHADAGEHVEAIEYLNQCISVSGTEESQLPKAYAILVSSLASLNRFQEASVVCSRGLELFPHDRELLFRQASLDQHQGRLQPAATGYRKLLNEQFERSFSSIDEGVYGYKALHNLATVLEEMGEWEEALEAWQKVTRERPSYRLGWRGLCRVMRATERLDEHLAIEALLESSEQRDLNMESCLAKSIRLEHLGEFVAALEILQRAMSVYTDDIDLTQEYCRLAFSHAPLGTAADALKVLTRLAPNDPSAHHNLGALLLQMGLFQESIESLNHSLSLRPQFEPTLAILHEAIARMRR